MLVCEMYEWDDVWAIIRGEEDLVLALAGYIPPIDSLLPS
jgi:hypothetical protein